MNTPLHASTMTAGGIFSNSIFKIPSYQREYSWSKDEVQEFWNDLKNSLDSDNYFLGLLILTQQAIDQRNEKHVVDGQQRIVTLTLLMAAIHHEAKNHLRSALAERIDTGFLNSIDYETEQVTPRVTLCDVDDNGNLQLAITRSASCVPKEDIRSSKILQAYQTIYENLANDLKEDSFRRLGKWSEFITNKLYFAVFTHPNPQTAYQVFEVINTRGKELTTADLLKNYIISKTKEENQNTIYKSWQEISKLFSSTDTGNTLVQYIRHIITVKFGYILPKDLFNFISGRSRFQGHIKEFDANSLINLMKDNLPFYIQMMDPTADGPESGDSLKVFSIFNSLKIINVRPIIIAISKTENPELGYQFLLSFTIKRVISGGMGTGTIDRRLSEAARKIELERRWEILKEELTDLTPSRGEFEQSLKRRSYIRPVLEFIRRSIIQNTLLPESVGTLYFIAQKNLDLFESTDSLDLSDRERSIGNTILLSTTTRPKHHTTWDDWKSIIGSESVQGEFEIEISKFDTWDHYSIDEMSEVLAKKAGEIWYK